MVPIPVEPKPLAEDLEATMEHTVAQADALREFVASAVRSGITRVYLLGCGGSYYSTFPAQELLESRTTQLTSAKMTSGEFNHRVLAGLDEKALVVCSTHSGATPETLEAAHRAKRHGATVVGIARSGEPAIGETSDLLLDYPSSVTVTEPKAIHFMLVALAALEAVGDLVSADDVWRAVQVLPKALAGAKAETAEIGRIIGQQWRDTHLVYVLGAGPNFGAANSLAQCYLQEMNWLDAAAVHAGDFFHGPFEILGRWPVLLLMGEDETRPMAERTRAFIEHYYPTTAVVDSRTFSLPGIPEDLRGLFSPLAVASAARRLLDHCAAERGHDSSIRRYMYKVQY